MSNPMVALSRLRRDLAKATTVDEVLANRDQAAALSDILKRAGAYREAAHEILVHRLECERKAGALLRGMEFDGGAREGKRGNTMLPRLEDLGLSKMQSHRLQRLADVSDEVFHAVANECREADADLTTAAVLRAWKQAESSGDSTPLEKTDTLIGAIARLRASIAKAYQRWPPASRSALAKALRSYADELDEHGRLDL